MKMGLILQTLDETNKNVHEYLHFGRITNRLLKHLITLIWGGKMDSGHRLTKKRLSTTEKCLGNCDGGPSHYVGLSAR